MSFSENVVLPQPKVQYSPLHANIPACPTAAGCDPGWPRRSAEPPSFCVTQIPSMPPPMTESDADATIRVN